MPIENDDFKTPGQLIEALLDQRGWTQHVLGVILSVDKPAISRMVSNKRAIDAPLALALEEIFGVPAEKFLELQRSYDLAKARIEARPDPERATRAQLLGGLPIAEMIRRGWINADNIRNVAAVQKELVRFFGVDRLDDIEVLPHAAKKTHVNTDPTPTQLAWLYRVRQITKDMIVPRYTKQAAAKAISLLKPLLIAAEGVNKVPRILAESGIRFAIVETLPSAKIDGVCFWLNEKSPVIAMTLRFDRIDNFWFVLRHELEHVIQGHGGSTIMLDADTEGEEGSGAIAEEERIANDAAADFCVPKKMMDAFIKRKAPFFTERDILGFARTIQVHPGLVAGQLRRRLNRYDKFREYLVPIRSMVAPGAMVDGWGDVAPVD